MPVYFLYTLKPAKVYTPKLIIFALALPLAAQTYFVPTGQHIGDWQRVSIAVCNSGPQSVLQTAAALQAEAMRAGWTLATNAETLRVLESAERASWQRKTLLTVEIAGWVATSLAASDLIVIREKWKAAFPLVSGGLRFATTAIPPRKVSIAPRPTLVQIAAGDCWEGEVLAVSRAPQ